jgi:hypothetical protein
MPVVNNETPEGGDTLPVAPFRAVEAILRHPGTDPLVPEPMGR